MHDRLQEALASPERRALWEGVVAQANRGEWAPFADVISDGEWGLGLGMPGDPGALAVPLRLYAPDPLLGLPALTAEAAQRLLLQWLELASDPRAAAVRALPHLVVCRAWYVEVVNSSSEALCLRLPRECLPEEDRPQASSGPGVVLVPPSAAWAWRGGLEEALPWLEVERLPPGAMVHVGGANPLAPPLPPLLPEHADRDRHARALGLFAEVVIERWADLGPVRARPHDTEAARGQAIDDALRRAGFHRGRPYECEQGPDGAWARQRLAPADLVAAPSPPS